MKAIKLNLFFIVLITINHISFAQCNDFVKIDGKKFKCGQSDFFAVVCNYFTEITWQTGSDLTNISFPNFYPSRQHSYFPNNMFCPQVTNQSTAFNAMKKDFIALKNKGFNTVRIYGAVSFNKNIAALDCISSYNTIVPYTHANYTNLLLDITANILLAASEAGIKVILLTGSNDLTDNGPNNSNYHASYVNYLEQLGARFKHNPTLMAVDLINEPSVHGAYWQKSIVCNYVNQWSTAIKQNSTILTTIGFWEVGSAFWWDPNLLSIDFASLHHYPFKTNSSVSYATDLNNAINRMKSDYWWYKENVKIPWIVGETGLTAHKFNINHPINPNLDNNACAGTIQDQSDYLQSTINSSRDNGATGYSWWEFTDQDPHNYSGGGGPYWGLIETSDALPNSNYTWKIAINHITNFNPSNIGTPTKPSLYYNYFLAPNNTGYFAEGFLIDQNNLAIKDGIIEVLTSTNKHYYTYSDNNGFFHVDCDNNIIRIQATATECSVITNFYNSPIVNNINIQLNKLPRPNSITINKNNQVISNANENIYAVNDINFNNYEIQSGTYNAKAGSVIKLNTGFKANYNTTFTARIGAYYHNCSTLSANGLKETNLDEQQIIKEENALISVYPNPSYGKYNVRLLENNYRTVNITNIYGALIKTINVNENELEVNLQDVSPGIYFFNFIDINNSIKTIKVIKQ